MPKKKSNGQQDDQVVTIELTSKKWKARFAIMFGVFLLGGILTVAGALVENQTYGEQAFHFSWILIGVGLAGVLIGFIGLIVVAVLAWWHHG